MTVRLGKYFLPNFHRRHDHRGLLVMKSKEGLEERLEFLFPDPAVRPSAVPSMTSGSSSSSNHQPDGLPGYFLIVMDFIQWAKDNGCPWARAGARVPGRWWPMR
jgi:DNA polymerase-3 subunit alpha